MGSRGTFRGNVGIRARERTSSRCRANPVDKWHPLHHRRRSEVPPSGVVLRCARRPTKPSRPGLLAIPGVGSCGIRVLPNWLTTAERGIQAHLSDRWQPRALRPERLSVAHVHVRHVSRNCDHAARRQFRRLRLRRPASLEYWHLGQFGRLPERSGRQQPRRVRVQRPAALVEVAMTVCRRR